MMGPVSELLLPFIMIIVAVWYFIPFLASRTVSKADLSDSRLNWIRMNLGGIDM